MPQQTPKLPTIVNQPPQANPTPAAPQVPRVPPVASRPTPTNPSAAAPSGKRPGAAAARPQARPQAASNANAANWNGNRYRAYPWYRGSWRSGYGLPFWLALNGFYGGWGFGNLYGPGYYGGPYAWLGGPSYAYANPYYQSTSVIVYDYSQPLAIPMLPPQAPLDPEAPEGAENVVAPAPGVDEIDRALAVQWLKSARAAFAQRNYAVALDHADKAIARLPSDPVLHEFRALALFARGDYRAAAATLYPVISAGPGWDWDTLKTFYSDVEEYTRHLRALEQYQRENPNQAEPSFVLAYHYLSLNEAPAATRQLENVVAQSPTDALARLLLGNLRKTNTTSNDRPRPQQP